MALRPTMALLALAAISCPASADEPDTDRFSKQVAPVLAKYCNGCHSGDKPKAGLSLVKYKDEESVLKDRKVWEKVVKNLRAREMPPEGKPKPTQAESELVTDWAEITLAKVDCGKKKDPGRVTIHRLNRAEYNNTIRDLAGVDFHPADDFPSDDVGYGFDNIGDVLSLPPLLLEKYLAAAEKIVDLAWKNEEPRQRIMICQPTGADKADCARKILRNFVQRAYRRPATDDDVARLYRLVEVAELQGDGFEKGIQLAVQAMLVSPHFLFRIERDRTSKDPDGIHPLRDFELASRLSYFLWSSMPDEELFTEARGATLRKNLEAQVRRMLKDPKATALVQNFAGQWLQLRSLKTDPSRFPPLDDKLRSAMVRETELFFEAIVHDDRSILDFLDADFTFLNEKLAKHYGIPEIKGDKFQRVSLKDNPQRGGVLTQASILTVTSNPTRTSPVKRGKWILENILGTPPPPPPDAGELSNDNKAVLSGSLRQRMEQHRANVNCATCHQRMDPLGFGFENFDLVGKWRTKDGSFPIDPSGTLPDGKSFKGPAELKLILKEKVELFSRCLSEKMLTYALGRGLEYYDKCAVDEIVSKLAQNENRFSALVLAICQSEPFQMRKDKK